MSTEKYTRIDLEFPVRPAVRFGWDSAPHPFLVERISANNERYRGYLRRFQELDDALSRIPVDQSGEGIPCWRNDWMPALDAVSLYGFTNILRPALYLEIGSGMSTKFVRQAIRDQNLTTHIVSIDPHPRSDVDLICDEVVRRPLEDCDLTVFDRLQQGDILFCDNSHRAFQNSDVTVFFTEILPRLKPGVWVGIHDIFLPHDYPEAWLRRFYNEQYLLAAWLLAGDRLQIEFPAYHCAVTAGLRADADPLLSKLHKRGANEGAGAFWFSMR